MELNKDQYPDGQISEDDDGATTMQIYVSHKRVILSFEGYVKWIGVTADGAIYLANLLIKHARESGSTKAVIHE